MRKIRPPFIGAYELFICPCKLSHPFPYHAVYCHQEIRLWPPCRQWLNLFITITSKEKGFCSKTNRIFFVLFHMSPLLKHTNIRIQRYGLVIVHLHDCLGRAVGIGGHGGPCPPIICTNMPHPPPPQKKKKKKKIAKKNYKTKPAWEEQYS